VFATSEQYIVITALTCVTTQARSSIEQEHGTWVHMCFMTWARSMRGHAAVLLPAVMALFPARYWPAPGRVRGSCARRPAPARAGTCTANNTCGGGEWPAGRATCGGFNPEGSDLSLTPRCGNNVYDSMGYLTMDFTCLTNVCQSDRDCTLVRPCSSAPVEGTGLQARPLQAPGCRLKPLQDEISLMPVNRHPLLYQQPGGAVGPACMTGVPGCNPRRRTRSP